MNFTHIVVGGTFDHIHTGHQVLLQRAFTVGKQVTIGLTTDKYVRNIKYPISNIQSYEIRKKQLETWLRKQGVLIRTTIVPIDDSYGPAITSRDYEAMVVSRETEKVAKKINALRIERELSPLAVIVIPMVQAEDAKRISSTRIRSGEIDHEGRLILPELLRSTLATPIGTLIPDGTHIPAFSKDTVSISVGDTTTAKLLSWGIQPTLACIDFQAHRQVFDWEKTLWNTLVANRSIAYFTSGPGYITQEVMDAMEGWSKHQKPTLFIIRGEEDLLVLPAILYASVGTFVFYGQPNKGIIEVAVTNEKKQEVKKLLAQFIHFKA